ncbi:hypothetical protein EH223_07120 [candidate division KSB1 bacterium]|nr:MAG: hypothetical protein EH223_07120 [candidate division KSB1 bacterium]
MIFYPHDHPESDFWGVIELRRHTQKIVTAPRKNVMMLTRNAEMAVQQAQDYASRAADFIPGDSGIR